MSNEIEMKRLSDVEAVETVSDEASVLIVQDGEVKQTAKSNVGGGGGVVWITNASPTVRKWNPSTESYEEMSEQEFKTAFQTGLIRVDGSGIRPTFTSAPTTVIGYQINDTYKAIKLGDNTTYQPTNW